MVRELDLMRRGSVPPCSVVIISMLGMESRTKLMEQKLWGSDLCCLSSLCICDLLSPSTRFLALRRNSIGSKGVYVGPYLMGWAAVGQPQTEALPPVHCLWRCWQWQWLPLDESPLFFTADRSSGPCCPHAFVEQAAPPLALRVQTGTVQPLQTTRTTHDATRLSANNGHSSYDQTLRRVPNCLHISWPRADLSSHLW